MVDFCCTDLNFIGKVTSEVGGTLTVRFRNDKLDDMKLKREARI